MVTSTPAFGPFSLDRSGKVLLRDGVPVEAGQRGIALLKALIEARGGTLTKAELIETAWPDVAVEEGNLTVQIAALRKVLGPKNDGGEWIATVPRVGYRLAVPANGTPHPTGLSSAPVLPAIAVLPFRNLSGDAGQTYFADGIASDIITALSRFRSLRVVARVSSFAYRDADLDMRVVARELGIGYVLEGNVRKAGERLRVGALLIDCETGASLWAENFDGIVDDVFDVQDRIVASVAAIVAPRIEQAELERSRRERPGSLAAYDLYLRALEKYERMHPLAHGEAVELLEQTISLGEAFVPAMALLANLLEHRISMGWPHNSTDRDRSIQLARRALELSSEDPVVTAHCCMVLLLLARDFDGAIVSLERAVALNPNNAMVVEYAGAAHLMGGDLERARDYFEQAISLSPAPPYASMAGLANVELNSGRYEEALSWSMKALAANTSYNPSHWARIAALGHLGRADEAAAAFGVLREQTPDISVSDAGRGWRDPGRREAIISGMRLAGLLDT